MPEQELVLVIEDSTETQQLLAELVLEPNGYRHIEALNGEEGLRLALHEHPTLIILDLQLPKMDGFDVLRGLRERNLQIPVVFTSIRQSAELIVNAFRLGAQDYVIKPFDPQEMVEAIHRVLEHDRQSRRLSQPDAQLQEANQKLERQVQELNTLCAIGHSVTSLLDLNNVLNRVVEAAVYLTGAEEGSLMLLDEESDELYLRASKDLGEKIVRNLRLRVEDSIAGQALRTNRSVRLAGEGAKIVTGYLVKSLLYVPLRIPDKGPIGVLGVANRLSKTTFSKRDNSLLSSLADYAAIAINHARLFEAVKTEQVKLEAVLREADEAIVVVDEENKIILCNDAARQALGISKSDLTHQPVNEVIQNPTLCEMFALTRESGQALHREITLENKRTFNAQITPVQDVGQVMTMQNVTQLKELDRLRSEYVSTVSHDLRTPLTNIQGYVELLSKVGPLNEQQESFIERVCESMDKITQLISDLLDIGRIEAVQDLEMSDCDLGKIIEDAIKELQHQAQEKDLDLRWEKPETLSLVRCNNLLLRQAVENLINNAIKYTSEGGWVAVRLKENESHILVSVADNGIGIPLENQPYIFDKFYRVDTEKASQVEGSGLGLSIVKAAIEKHNGRVWVESKPGQGSVFSFVLPALEPSA